jgi:DNA ligase (NAD+)
MTFGDPRQRAQELREQIRYHNHRYYVLNDPVINYGRWRRSNRS